MRILLIEDDANTAEAIRQGLSAAGHTVTVTLSGEAGLCSVLESDFDLMLLDWMLPGRPGIEILQSVRKVGLGIKVLLLTARDGIEDRVLGLDSGADDYLVKPFAFPELLARVRMLGRRGKMEEVEVLRFAELEVNLINRTALRGGQSIELTHKEFDLLAFLIRSQGHVVSREMLAKEVWHETARATPLDNVIDVHMTRLRKKIDEQSSKKLIKTIRGVGFILSE
jgi:two-component system, OmpR family, copper resistance phosphate regulon response regulator CusR